MKKAFKTYIDRVVGYVWIVIGVTGFMISITAMFFWNLPILFIVILLRGVVPQSPGWL
jgi:hypothetical protein